MKITTPSLPEQQFKGLVTGLHDYLQKTEVADKVVLGLSGGIDSSLVACIAKEALGADKVIGITMPSEFSSTGSVTDSEKLATNLGIELHKMAIKDTYDSFTKTLAPLFEDTSFGVAEENLQPRIRGTLLMAYSNKFGHMLLNTGNKSELATGYSTLYGDMAGGLSVIGDLYKQEVYAMARWLNHEYYQEEIIPQSVLDKPPSAELRPDQKDADSLPDYEVLDAILKAYIEEQKSIDEIIDRINASFGGEVVADNISNFIRLRSIIFGATGTFTIGDSTTNDILTRWGLSKGTFIGTTQTQVAQTIVSQKLNLVVGS
jgi:NAD+ synthetase